jgi:hypothetical protein
MIIDRQGGREAGRQADRQRQKTQIPRRIHAGHTLLCTLITGFVCDLHENPANFFMDVIQEASEKDEDNQGEYSLNNI